MAFVQLIPTHLTVISKWDKAARVENTAYIYVLKEQYVWVTGIAVPFEGTLGLSFNISNILRCTDFCNI